MDTGNDENVSLITPNFSLVNQEIATLTIGLKDNKIIDDLTIGEDSSDMLLVNSETTFINNTTFSNNVKITDNLQVDNLNIDGNTISSTDTTGTGNMSIVPNGTGAVIIPKVDIDGGTIDGVTIGSNTAAAGTFTSLNVSAGSIGDVNDIALKTITYNSIVNITYIVTVQNSKYYLNGTQHPVLNLEPGTYTFDQSDPTNGATPPYQPHPLRFYTNNTSSGTTNEYKRCNYNGTPGSSVLYTYSYNIFNTTPIYYGCFNRVYGSEINVVFHQVILLLLVIGLPLVTCANLELFNSRYYWR